MRILARGIITAICLTLGLAIGGAFSAQALTPDQRVILLVQPQPTLNLDFRACSGIDSRISFTRAANTATFWGSNLLLQTANANVPRLDFNYATGSCNGFEIEQASTNVAIQNRDLTNAAWVKVTTTAAKDQTGIDGAANAASSLLATAGNGTTLQTVVHVSSTDTYSVYLKRLTGTGEIDLSLDGVIWTAANSSICTLGNGNGVAASNIITTAWVRCTITQATVVNPAFGIRIVTNADMVEVDYCLLEVLGFPTSPIATTTVAVARNADVATIATSAFGFNPPNQTLFVRAMYEQVTSGVFTDVASIASVSGSDAYFDIQHDGGQFLIDNQAASSQTQIFSRAYTTSQVPFNMAIGWQSGNYALSLNGTLTTNSVVVTQPGAVTQLNLGTRWTGGKLNGWLQQVKYWPQRLPNQTLIQMTLPGQQSMLVPANDNVPIKLASNY